LASVALKYHTSDQDIERYLLDTMTRPEMLVIEEHLL
jgi:hypothetical protein